MRQEVPIEPQPTLGAAVTAMERRGFFTRRGDALRGDILVPSLAYESAHAVVLDVQRKQAVEDAIRERTDPAARAARLAAEASSVPSNQSQFDASTAAPLVQAPLAKPPLEAPAGSLVARFHAAAPAPNTLEERLVFLQVLKIVAAVERVLAALIDLVNRFRHNTEDRDRRMAAKLAADYELDVSRAQRASAKEKVEQWEASHRWKVATSRAFGGSDGIKPKAWQSLIEAFEASQRRVQVLKTSLLSHQVHLDAFDKNEVELKTQQANATDQLGAALATLAELNQAAIEPLMSVAQGNEFQWLKDAMPETVPAPEMMLAHLDSLEATPRRRRAFH